MNKDEEHALLLAGIMADAAIRLVGGMALNNRVHSCSLDDFSHNASVLRRTAEQYNDHIMKMATKKSINKESAESRAACSAEESISSTADLCKLLRDNSSGIYWPLAQAADLIERQQETIKLLQLIAECKRTAPTKYDNRLNADLSQKSLEVLEALASMAANDKKITIAKDWGFGGATLIDESGNHAHVGGDFSETREENLALFIHGMHDFFVKGQGLSWVQSVSQEEP